MQSLSVIIPACNGAEHLGATLRALAAQTSPACEVIVVDDGSTDGTGELAADFTFPDGSRPTVLRHEIPQGVAVARNRGVFAARGQWVALCDSDDLWHPRRLEHVGRAAASHPQAHAIATGSVGFALDADRRALAGHQRAGMVAHWVAGDDIAGLSGLVDDSNIQHREVTLRELQQEIVFATTTVCYRRESYALVGGSSVLAFHADNHVLNVSVATLGPIVLVDAPLVFYRVRAGSESHDDGVFALPFLAASVAVMSGGRQPDDRPAGSLYRHMLGKLARSGAPLSSTVGFALIGRVGPRSTLSAVKAKLVGRLPHGTH